MKGYILLIYTVLPTMSSMAFSAFNVDRVSGEQHGAPLLRVLPSSRTTHLQSLTVTHRLPRKYDCGQGCSESYMTVDHRIPWWSETKDVAQALAWIMIVIFPVGVPLALFTQLFVNRDQIKRRRTRSGDRDLGYIGASVV